MTRRSSALSAGSNPSLFQAPLFAGLPTEVVQDFLERAQLVTLPPNRNVFQAGEPARIYMLASGRVKITRRGEHGRENILIIAGPGELLGSLNLFTRSLLPTSATALSPTEVLELSTDSMRAWLEANPAASMNFIRLLVDRLQRQNDAMHDIFGLDVGTRVARAIVREARRFGRQTDEGTRVNLGLSQEELALHVRASRESVNQTLSSFAKQGWIRRDGTEVIVLDEDQLMQRALRDN